MLRRLVETLRTAFPNRGDGASAGNGPDGENEVETSGFVRSRLDATVARSHGDGNPDGERELASVLAAASRLEEQRHGG